MMGEGGELDEVTLVERAIKQDHEAFALLVDRYASTIYTVALRMVGEPADAQDVAQESFVSAYKALPLFRGDSKFSTWIHRITINKCKDWLRAHPRVAEAVLDDNDRESTDPLLVDPTNPEQEISRKQMGMEMERAIQALQPLYREAFLLKHVEGLNYEEMSTLLGVAGDTLKMRVYKARVRLCRDLAGLGDG
jgi:RNA polymerase sigma-70 factor (ECF subfamily)